MAIYTALRMLTPIRVIFNYAVRCNMPCGFCYVPFNSQKTTLAEKLRFIDRLKDIGTELVTFGGGDPLMDKEFTALVAYAVSKGLTVQLDTNGLGLHKNHLPMLRDHIAFMSLPLEGDAETNAAMRGNTKHFNHVLTWIPRLLDQEVKLKINTVASRQNIAALPALADILMPFTSHPDNPIARWSVYEFIPAELGDINKDAYELLAGEFNACMDRLKKDFPALPLEPGPRTNRKSAYFFMNDNGMVYIGDQTPARDGFLFIGHIMDADIVRNWSHHLEKKDQGHSFKNRADLRIGLIP